ncbi:MAG: hypothetical protein ACLQNE_41365 [Thermoguttaceae bacterium]
MSSSNDRKREERAFDLLIASQLGRERDIANPDDLPELTAEELAAMGSVPSDIIAQLWDQEDAGQNPGFPGHAGPDRSLVGAGGGICRGFYRAPEIKDEDHEKLDEARRQVIDELNATTPDKKCEDDDA